MQSRKEQIIFCETLQEQEIRIEECKSTPNSTKIEIPVIVDTPGNDMIE